MTITQAKKYLARAKKKGAAINRPEILQNENALGKISYGINVELDEVIGPIWSADIAEEHFPVKHYTWEA